MDHSSVADARRLHRPRVGAAMVAGLLMVGVAVALLPRDAVSHALTGVRIEGDIRSELSSPSSAAARHVLVVGTDRRPMDRDAGDPSITGAQADVVVVLTTTAAGDASALSLPRSLRVVTPALGRTKLSQSRLAGRAEVIAAVQALTGLPLHGYLELDPAALVAAVDGVGGVDVVLDRPMRDRSVGLDLGHGEQRLDGGQALGWVRSRSAEHSTGGVWQRDQEGDLGRLQRQHRLMAALRSALPRDPLTLLRLLRAVGPHVTMDSTSTALQALTALRHAQFHTLPTAPITPVPLTLSPFPPAHYGALPTLRTTAEGRRWLEALAVGDLPADTLGGRP